MGLMLVSNCMCGTPRPNCCFSPAYSDGCVVNGWMRWGWKKVLGWFNWIRLKAAVLISQSRSWWWPESDTQLRGHQFVNLTINLTVSLSPSKVADWGLQWTPSAHKDKRKEDGAAPVVAAQEEKKQKAEKYVFPFRDTNVQCVQCIRLYDLSHVCIRLFQRKNLLKKCEAPRAPLNRSMVWCMTQDAVHCCNRHKRHAHIQTRGEVPQAIITWRVMMFSPPSLCVCVLFIPPAPNQDSNITGTHNEVTAVVT